MCTVIALMVFIVQTRQDQITNVSIVDYYRLQNSCHALLMVMALVVSHAKVHLC